MELIEELKQEFFLSYKNKYTLLGDESLGEGHYACVFKAYDIDRNVEVAIKIFFKGITPKGSERGWHITSSVIHNQIAQTNTIETFYSALLKRECKAVIQRFIPGKTLNSLLNKFDKLAKGKGYQTILNDFGLSYLISLLEVLSFCHNQNFGHGDCHDGNIMVFLESHETRNIMSVILIDFDNSSIKQSLNSNTEKEKIESDIGLFKYFFKKAFYDWKYYTSVSIMFESYDSIREFQISYSIVSDFISFCIKGGKSKEGIKKILEKLPHPFMGFNYFSTIESLQSISEIENIEETFEEALEEHKKAILNPINWEHEVSIEVFEDGITNIYRDLFEN